MQKVEILDTTLRDGAQSEGISFSVRDKLAIVETLDNLGVALIEAGNPGSNPKDLAFFEEVRTLKLKHARLAAFGATRRPGVAVADDAQVRSLVSAGTPVLVIFGKSWDLHVTEVLKTTLDENRHMIRETLAYAKKHAERVVYDAEHFYDGYRANPEYALLTLEAAVEAGADVLCLCDTNGGRFPEEVAAATQAVAERFGRRVAVGVHTHNDSGLAVANTLAAVRAGAAHVQGTLVGFGERCGNANLATIIANLQLKAGYTCLPAAKMAGLTAAARRVAEIANIVLADDQPYVGTKAFTHKAGMHMDGVRKCSASFEHVPPESVGNARRFLISEIAGRSAVLARIQRVAPHVQKSDKVVDEVVAQLKALEQKGYQFEGADGSFELLVRKALGTYKPHFALEHYQILGERPAKNEAEGASAIVKVRVGDSTEITAAQGDGPVNALDRSLRKALERFYPVLAEVRLTDFKVRVLDGNRATEAKVRVLIESTDGRSIWTTVGVSFDIIEASWFALVDSIEYHLSRTPEKKGPAAP
jgi:2-isopropylmalate synthase